MKRSTDHIMLVDSGKVKHDAIKESDIKFKIIVLAHNSSKGHLKVASSSNRNVTSSANRHFSFQKLLSDPTGCFTDV